MTPLIATAVLLGFWPVAGPAVRWAGIGAVLGSIHPVAALGSVLIPTALVLRRGPFRSRGTQGGQALLADQVALGLRAGLTLEGSLHEAVPDLDPQAASRVRGVLREARRIGLASVLADATGSGERLFRIAARAVRTGAPLIPAVEGLADELRHEEHTRRTARARRLPVRLLLPLALLILPGFVLVVVAPALIGSLARLEIGW
jgi:hypothetical protein